MENIITIIDKKKNFYTTIYDTDDCNVYDLLDDLVGTNRFLYQKNTKFNTLNTSISISFATTFIIK